MNLLSLIDFTQNKEFGSNMVARIAIVKIANMVDIRACSTPSGNLFKNFPYLEHSFLSTSGAIQDSSPTKGDVISVTADGWTVVIT